MCIYKRSRFGGKYENNGFLQNPWKLLITIQTNLYLRKSKPEYSVDCTIISKVTFRQGSSQAQYLVHLPVIVTIELLEVSHHCSHPHRTTLLE